MLDGFRGIPTLRQFVRHRLLHAGGGRIHNRQAQQRLVGQIGIDSIRGIEKSFVGRLELSKLAHDGRGFIQIAHPGVDFDQLHPRLDPNLLFLNVWERFFQIAASPADVARAFLSDAQKRLRLP